MPDTSDVQPVAAKKGTPPAVLGPTVEGLEARILQLETQVAQLRRALKDYYDVDGKGFVG